MGFINLSNELVTFYYSSTNDGHCGHMFLKVQFIRAVRSLIWATFFVNRFTMVANCNLRRRLQ